MTSFLLRPQKEQCIFLAKANLLKGKEKGPKNASGRNV
jgi:hypothetical protein